MIALRRLAFASLACALASPIGWAQVSRFDMGPSGQTVEPGWIGIDPQTVFASPPGYGWLSTATPSSDYDSGVLPQSVFIEEELPADVLGDGVSTSSSCTFRIERAANTRWQVTVLLGTPGEQAGPLLDMDVSSNGITVVEDTFAALQHGKASINPSENKLWGGYKRCTFVSQANGSGIIDLTFSGASRAAVMGIEIRPQVAEPVRFDHTSKSLVSTTGYAYLDSALQDLNDDEYADAKAKLDAISTSGNELGLAWAYAWLAGWLTGDMEAVDTDLLDTIEALLLQAPDTSPRALLLRDVRFFRAGELFLRTRGYSPSVFPENPDSLHYLYPGVDPWPPILLNSFAGIQLLEQLQGDILETAPVPLWPQSPFYAKAQYLIARNMYGRNSHMNVGTGEYNEYLLGILDRLWPRLQDIYPKADEAITLTWYLREHITPPLGPLEPWQPGDHPPISVGSTWWDELTDFSDDPNAPDWANEQRRYSNLLRNVAAWWIEHREIDGEIGGGAGDDVEAAAVVVPTITRSEHPSHLVESGWKRILETTLFGDEVSQDQGYWEGVPPGGLIDPEHGGEYTSYPLFWLIPTHYGKPTYLEFAMRNARNMIEGNPTQWTDVPSWTTWRHFKTFLFSAHGVASDTDVWHDTTENMKTILPSLSLIDYNTDPKLHDTLYELSRAWADAAMKPHASRPEGILPPAVDFHTGMLGYNNVWWKNHPLDTTGGLGIYYDALYGMMISLARTYTPGSAENVALLEPIQSAVEYVYSKSGVTVPSTPIEGTEPWLVGKARKFVSLAAFLAREDLIQVFGSSDPTFPAKLDFVIQSYGGDYENYLLSTQAPKTKTGIEAMFAADAEWLRYFWPLATTAVTYADRIKFATKDLKGMPGLYATAGGAPYTPAPLFRVSWFNPDTGGDSDLAILVHHVDSSAGPSDVALKVLLFNFGTSTQPLGLRVWRGLPLGVYDVCLGPDANRDDVIDGSPTCTTNVDFAHRGDSVVINVPAGTLQVLELEVVSLHSPAAALLPDPAIEDKDLQVSGTTLTIDVHNLGGDDHPLAGGIRVMRTDTGQQVAAALLPAIPAPNDLSPSSQQVNMTLPSLPAGTELKAVLLFGPTYEQITDENDVAYLVL